VHVPTHATSAGSAAAAALRAAAAPSPGQGTNASSLPVRDATTGAGLPPGAAQSFADPKLSLRDSGTGGATLDVATLTDFDGTYHGGGRYGSRFDTLDGLDESLVCGAAGVAARAWWALSGGSGTPSVNCTMVAELLRCLLLPAAPPPVGRHHPSYACPLAAELGVEGNLSSHYTGVYMASAEAVQVSSTTEFARRFLTRTLNASCELTVPPASACEPVVMLHDAYSPGIERDGGKSAGGWRVTDETEPIWAESNWPPEMHTVVYPHGAPRTVESIMLIVFGLVVALLTFVAVKLSQKSYKEAYKRL
jgi:hypothetical protein